MAATSATRVRHGRRRSERVPILYPGRLPGRLATDWSAHRVRLAAFLCPDYDDAVPRFNHIEPVPVHVSNGEGLRPSGIGGLRHGIFFLCDLVHLGVVLLRRAVERSHLPPLCAT